MININTATATATDLPHSLIQTLRCHEKKVQIEPQARFCETKLSEPDTQNSGRIGGNILPQTASHSPFSELEI